MQRNIFGGDSEFEWVDYFLIGKVHFNGKNMDEGMKYLVKARDIVRIQELNEYETFAELNLLLCKGYFGTRRFN